MPKAKKAPDAILKEVAASKEGGPPQPLPVIMSMFSKGPAAARSAAARPAVARPAAARPAVARSAVARPAAVEAPVAEDNTDLDVAEVPVEAPAEVPVEAPVPRKFAFKKTIAAQTDAAAVIAAMKEEVREPPYEIALPPAYIPDSRRSFTGFIQKTYEEYTLPSDTPTPSGEKYPYQKFVREYMRQETPYRGVLVFHGLGTGKTCTSIATAEALYAVAHKKIIVLTKASLKDTYLEEISKCGFRHFRLENHWVKFDKDPATILFAQSVLLIPQKQINKQTGIWLPDFRADRLPNYSEKTAQEQTEIREQINSILIWDEKTNPSGLIRFISYNGGTAEDLRSLAADTPDAFDNAVIVIDEVHNLISNIHMAIDKFLLPTKGRDGKIRAPLETIDNNKWKPQEGRTYSRGYLFYRILLGVKNTKIVALSGTPIINSLEEAGILMNILHGYIPTLTYKYSNEKVMAKNRFLDFVKVENGLATCTLLPYGIEQSGDGVKRVEKPTAMSEIIAELEKSFGPTLTNEAKIVLPPFGEQFRELFINRDKLQNKMVLVKRLSGLISYYKGGREDLMPRIKVDEIVRVPMSAFSMAGYTEVRSEEIKKEKKPTKDSGEEDESKTANYKMASRQASNFVFPSSVTRPRASNLREELTEAVGNETDLLTTDAEKLAAAAPVAPVAVAVGGAGDGKEAEEEATEEEATEEEEGKEAEEAEEEGKEAEEEEATEEEGKEAEDCKTGRKKGEAYPVALERSKACLQTIALNNMKLGGENGLEKYSPKYAEIIKRIRAAPGSSLVYSQFLQMEGIGILEIAMKVNGYDAIELTQDGLSFTPETLASLQNPEKNGFRFIRFSGGEDPKIRKALMNVFNANYSKLSKNIQDALKTFENNHTGQLCRVFSITAAGAEGLSLKCVRAVHIMEPYWNDVRLKQVKGRAVRINSHIELPERDRDVSIYTYVSVFPEDLKADVTLHRDIISADNITMKDTLSITAPDIKNYVLTTDEMIFLIAQRKKRLIDAFECLMKSAAVDCPLNHAENDEEYQCFSLKGAVGGFLSHPDIVRDITDTKASFPTQDTSMFASCDKTPVMEEAAAPVASVAAKAELKPKGLSFFASKKSQPASKLTSAA